MWLGSINLGNTRTDRAFSFFMRYLYCFIIVLLYQSCVKEIGNEAQTENVNQEESEELTQLMNLLINGNCEKWVWFPSSNIKDGGDYLSGWYLKDNKGSVFCESDIIYEGQHSAKLSSPQSGVTAFISQKVEVPPGHRIRIVFHYRMDYIEGTGARMYCYFRENGTSNIANDILYTFYDEATLDIIRGGGYDIDEFSDTKGEWRKFDYTIQVPAIAHYFVFEIHAYVGTNLYVDDCYVIDVDM